MSSKPPLMIPPASNNNGNTMMESRTSDLTKTQVCVTLGGVPQRRS